MWWERGELFPHCWVHWAPLWEEITGLQMLKDELGIKNTWFGGGCPAWGAVPYLPLASGTQGPSDACHPYSQILVSFSPCGHQRIPCIATKMFLATRRDCSIVHKDFSLALAYLANSCGLSKELQDTKTGVTLSHQCSTHQVIHSRLPSHVLALAQQELNVS